MCGIFAAVSPGFTEQQGQHALRALEHRGPDGDGTWRNAARDVFLGHTRLTIVDLVGGAQPMVNESGDVAVVVNGEFYGYERIMAGLRARGHRLQSRCDSEILLHLYEERGLEAVEDLRGEFAFAIWDQRERRLVAGRDRFGIKPLFYSLVPGGLWLASEAKALFAAGLRAAWDEEAFYQELFLTREATRSLFDGVSQLPAGHLLIFEQGRARTERYWDLDYPVEADLSSGAPDDDIAALRDALDDAVRVRLKADTPVGYFLSGGLDSSAVLSMGRRHEQAPGRAFTVCFDQAEYDEGEQARETARGLGALFTPIAVSKEQMVRVYPDAVAQAETLGNLHAAARYLQCRAVQRAGYKVALTGDGADEVFAGYVHYGSDVRHEAMERVPAMLRPLQARLGSVPCWVRMLAVERSVFGLLLADDYRRRMRECQPYLNCLDALDGPGQLADRHPLHQSLYLWSRTMLQNYVLAAERLEMAFGVETRLPYLDHVLFETVRRLPPSLLVHERKGKWALRAAARELLPPAVLAQTKHPFAAPSGLSQPGSTLFTCVDETLRGDMLKDMPFFDRAAVLSLWTQLPETPPSRRFALEPVMLMIFCACVLHRRYVSA